MVKTSPFNAGAMSLIPGGDPSVKEPCNAGDTGLIPGQEEPLEEDIATHSSILAGYSP